MYWFQLQAATNPDFNPVVVDDSGRSLYSWRIPYFSINSPSAFSINEPWSSPENISSEFYGEDAFCELNSTNPYMMAVVKTKGKEKVFSGIELLKRKGDNARDLIILVEVYAPSVHWMEPIDLSLEDFSSNNPFSAISNEAGIEHLGSPERAGVLVGFANGDVWLIRKSIPRSLLEKFMSSSSQLLDKDELLAPYRLPMP